MSTAFEKALQLSDEDFAKWAQGVCNGRDPEAVYIEITEPEDE